MPAVLLRGDPLRAPPERDVGYPGIADAEVPAD